MTIEQKAKAYDEAIHRANITLGCCNSESDLTTINTVYNIFPGLQESEDGRIRKALLRGFKNYSIYYDKFGGADVSGIIAWLEKQGEQMKVNSEVIKDYTGVENVWNSAHDFRPKHLQRCLCYDKYMGGVYCYVYDDIDKYWCTQTTKEHDPDGYNHISDYTDYRVTVWMKLPATNMYPSKVSIEKQGEQPKEVTCTHEVETGNGNIKALVTEKIQLPKFHEGEWITNGQLTCKVLKVTGKFYDLHLYNDDYCHFETDVQSIDKDYHLWTIKDAKDGDILTTSAGAFIYNGNNGGGCCPGCYCGINTLGNFKTGTKHHWTTKPVFPATKEQRDTLFAKMKEAGYEWNAEKKELKLLITNGGDFFELKNWEQNSAWNNGYSNGYIQAIEKAVEWLENHNDYIDVKDGNVTYFDMRKCVEDFGKYMKGGEQ